MIALVDSGFVFALLQGPLCLFRPGLVANCGLSWRSFRLSLGFHGSLLLNFAAKFEHFGRGPLRLLPQLLAIVLFEPAILLDLLFAFDVSLAAFLLAFEPLLLLLRPRLELACHFFLSLHLCRQLLGLGCDDALKVQDALAKAVHLGASTEKFLVDLKSLLVLLLSLKGVPKCQESVHVVSAVLNALLEVNDGGWVLRANAVQDGRVVVHDGIGGVQFNRRAVEAERLGELARSFHVDSHVLQDARLPRVVPHGRLVLLHRLLAVSELFMDDSQVDFGLVVIGLHLKHLV